MSKIVSRIAAVAALALAATPIIGLTAAHASEPVARIAISDLRLSRPADAQEFARRVDVAASRTCAGKTLRGLSAKTCRANFAEDVKASLSDNHMADLRIAQRAGADVELASN